MGEVLDPDHGGDDKEVDQGSQEEQPAGQEPDEARHPAAQIEPVQSEKPQPPGKPEEVCHGGVLHGRYLGKTPTRFLVE